MSTQRVYQLLISFAIITAIAFASDKSRVMASILSVMPLSMTLGLWFIYTGANGYSLADAGVIVPPCDSEALALGIRRFLEDGNLRRGLGQRGREHVLQHFSYQCVADLSVRTYERYLKTGSGGVR